MEPQHERPTIHGRLLAQLLRIQYDTLRFGWRATLPPLNPGEQRLKYDYPSVTTFLNRDVRGFTSVPTAEDLVSGKLKLLTPDEVVGLIPRLTQKQLAEVWAARGKMAALKVGGQLRFELSSVLRIARPPARYTVEQTCHILGVKQGVAVRKLIKAGRLQSVIDAEDGGREPRVTRRSLIRLLCGPDGLLPNSADELDAADWIATREASTQHLLLTADAMRFTGEGIHRFMPLVIRGELDYIWSPNKKERYFCPLSLLAYVEQFPLTNIQVSQVYGADRKSVWWWLNSGMMQCRLHPHAGGDHPLYRACLIELLRGHLSPGMNPANWLANRLGTDIGLMGLDEAAAELGMERQALVEAAAAGTIGGIRTPGRQSGWRFSYQRIERLARSRRRESQ